MTRCSSRSRTQRRGAQPLAAGQIGAGTAESAPAGRTHQQPGHCLNSGVLEQTLEEFDGTLLIVSHDRYFLDQVVDRVVELKDGRFTEFDGAYTDYLAAGGRM